MRMPEPVLQRVCAPCAAGGPPCPKCKDEKELRVQRRAAPSPLEGEGQGEGTVPNNFLQGLGSGQPLDQTTRAFFEPRFGADFSPVRVHTDSRAAESAREVNAHAYTVGQDIVFGAGQFAPGTHDGRRLIAHELTHVAQQSKPWAFQARNTVQRQTSDMAKGETSAETVGSEKAMSVCEPPCGKFPWFEVAPDRFMSLCDDSVSMSGPLVTTVGCPPSGSGTVVFVSGSPAWSLTNGCSYCTAPASEKKPMPRVEVGYIQTVEKALSGGVYYKQDAAGKWKWSGNQWLCVANARDSHKTSSPPWFGPDASGNFGPLQYPLCPSLADNPFVKLPSHKDGGTLRRMRIDGVFHIWLIAKPATGPIVFIHSWDIALWVVTELADNGHPCNQSAWNYKFNGTKVTASGPGKGSATPMLTGQTANNLKQPC